MIEADQMSDFVQCNCPDGLAVQGLTVDGSDLRISTRAAGIRRAQEVMQKYVAGKPSMADELIAERDYSLGAPRHRAYSGR